METFKAEEKSVRNLFQEKIGYKIPSYQRPYSWERDEIEKFCEDIMLSYINKEEYLLSSIILVEKKKDKLYEVIDGQQRLTTISIFLSVLKSFLKNQENIEDINSRILNGAEIRVQRVQTDKSYHQDFQEVLQNFNYDSFKELFKKRKYRKNNYYQNAVIIYEFLNSENYNKIDFDNFYEDFFIDQVYLIRVNTNQEQKAMKLFEVLNSRGLPLKNSDLIKNHIMEKIYENYEEENKENGINAFEELWKEISSKMEDLNESIEDLFTYYVYMKLKENPKSNLFEEFKKIIKRDFNEETKIDKFIEEFHKFYNEYIELFAERKDIETFRKIHSMRYLREGRFWKTILITYRLKNPSEEIQPLVDTLFEFYYLNFIAGESVNPYKQFSFKLIKDVAEGSFELSKLKLDMEDYYKKQNTIYRFKSKLKDEIYGERWAKVLFYLIEYFCEYKEKEDYEIFEQNNKKIQIEHILPQNGRFWKDIIDKEKGIKELTNTFGNLTLLYQSNNVKCSNSNFETKLEIYKQSKKFNHTKEILKFGKWNSESISQRENKLLQQVEKIFNLPAKSLTEDKKAEEK